LSFQTLEVPRLGVATVSPDVGVTDLGVAPTRITLLTLPIPQSVAVGAKR
jgi:hypothetical protein